MRAGLDLWSSTYDGLTLELRKYEVANLDGILQREAVSADTGETQDSSTRRFSGVSFQIVYRHLCQLPVRMKGRGGSQHKLHQINK